MNLCYATKYNTHNVHKNGEKGLNIIDIMIFRYEGMFQGRERQTHGERGAEGGRKR